MVTTPDVYVTGNPGQFREIGRWLKSQLDAGTIAAENKEHLLAVINNGVEFTEHVGFDEDNVLVITLTASPSGLLRSTLRAMGWSGE